MENVEQDLQTVRKVFVDYPKQYDLAKDQLVKINQERQDLLHVIELGKLDAIALSRTVRELKRVQQVRRKLKSEIEVLEEVTRFINNFPKNRKHEINQAIGNVRSVQERQKRRIYTMRIRKDLQEYVR